MIGLITGNLNFGSQTAGARTLSDTHQVPLRNREGDVNRRRLRNRHHRRRRVWLHQITGGHREIAGLAGDRRANGCIAELHPGILNRGLFSLLRGLQVRNR